MAVAIISDFPRGSQDRYDAVMADLNLERDCPAGLIVHGGGPIEGGWRVIDALESEQDAEEFYQGRLPHALERAGVTGPPQVAVTPLHNLVR